MMVNFFEAYLDSLAHIYGNLFVEFSSDYITKTTVTSIIIGLIAAACIIVAAVLTKKNVVLGCVAGGLQIAGCWGTQHYANHFVQYEWFEIKYIVGNSQADLDAKISEFYRELISEVLVPVGIGGVLMLVGWIMAMVFIIKCLSQKPKIMPLFALIIHIVRFLWIPPYNLFGAAVGPILEDAHASYNTVVYISTLIPMLLVLGCAIINFVKSAKTPVLAVEGAEVAAVAEAPVEDAPVEAPVEDAPVEASVEDVPVAEAPVEEAVKEE